MQKQPDRLTTQPGRARFLGPCSYVFDAANTGSWRIERPQVDYENCIRCGICERSCPTGVITVHKQGAESVSILWDHCKGCGVCANECPRQCIAMVPERRED